MKTSDSTDVIQGDEQCRDGHYRTKLDLRTICSNHQWRRSGRGVGSERLDFPTGPKPNRFGQAQSWSCFSRGSRHSRHLEHHALRNW